MFRKFLNNPAYRRDQNLKGVTQIRQWWESRRWYFNKVVGSVGIATTSLMIACGFISDPLVGAPIGIPDPPVLVPIGIFVYGVGANVCFTGGWILECLLSKWQFDTNAFGVRAFRAGINFSIVLTVLPALLCWFSFVLALATGRRIDSP